MRAMVKRSRLPAQRMRRHPVFFREWRQFRQLNQEQAAERIGITQGTLSKIERGETHYTQSFLEAVAEAYACTPADLLMRNPLDEDAVWSITDSLLKADPAQRRTISNVIDALLKKAN